MNTNQIKIVKNPSTATDIFVPGEVCTVIERCGKYGWLCYALTPRGEKGYLFVGNGIHDDAFWYLDLGRKIRQHLDRREAIL